LGVRRAEYFAVMCLTGLAGVIGCAAPNSVVYSVLNTPPRAFARRPPATVDVVVGKPPLRPYVDVGMFEVYQGRDPDGARRSTEDMLRTLRMHAALRGCDAVQVMGVELAGKRYWRVVRGVCEMYTDPQAVEADKHLIPERLPGEGQFCEVVTADPTNPAAGCPDIGYGQPCGAPAAGAARSTAAPAPLPGNCADPLVCVKSVCSSPYQ
jgi:hypothetical protein